MVEYRRGGGGTIVTQPLAQGVDYQIQASGALEMGYAYGDNQEGDAGYVDFDSGQTVSGDPENNDFPYGIFINGKNPGWGQYNPSHVYTVNYVGNGKPLDLYYSDDYYPDNSGNLSVTITGPNTSVTVSDAANPSNEAQSMILGQFAPQTLYVPETSAGNAVVTLDGDLGAGADWSVDGSTASPSSGTASGPTNITLTPTSGNDDYTLDVTANDQAWTLDIDVIPWEIDAQTMENGQPQGLLPLNQRMSPGAFVPVDDGDSNYDGWLDDQEPNNGPPPANDDRLLQVTLNGTGDPNNADNYTVSDQSGFVRLFYLPAGSTTLKQLTPSTPLPTTNDQTVYVEGVKSGIENISVNWNVNGTTYSGVDAFQVSVFKMTGPLDVPGNGTYEYKAQTVLPGGFNGSPLLPTGAAWITPNGGSLATILNPGDVTILWNNPAAGEVGEARFQVNSEYTWDFDVNVVGWSIIAGSSTISYGGPPTQPDNTSSNINSTPGVGAGAHAIQGDVKVQLAGPPGPGGVLRGLKFMQLGYIQNLTITQYNGIFQDGTTVTSPLQGASNLVDSNSSTYAPWYEPPVTISSINNPTTPLLVPHVPMDDTPKKWGVEGGIIEDAWESPLAFINVLLNFKTWLVAATDQTISGGKVVQASAMTGTSPAVPTSTQGEYAPMAEAQWYFDGSGSFSHVVLSSPYNPEDVYTSNYPVSGGNSGSTSLGPVTDPIATAFSQTANDIINSASTNWN